MSSCKRYYLRLQRHQPPKLITPGSHGTPRSKKNPKIIFSLTITDPSALLQKQDDRRPCDLLSGPAKLGVTLCTGDIHILSNITVGAENATKPKNPSERTDSAVRHTNKHTTGHTKSTLPESGSNRPGPGRISGAGYPIEVTLENRKTPGDPLNRKHPTGRGSILIIHTQKPKTS